MEGSLLLYPCDTHTTVATPLPFLAKKATHGPSSLFLRLFGSCISQFFTYWLTFWAKKGRGVATVVCVQHRYTSKFPSTNSNTHTTMATPLSIFTANGVNPICVTLIWVAFSIYLKGLMRVIIISGTMELILIVVKMSQIFLLNYCYCKIANSDPLKGRFKRKKWKDVQSDGTHKIKAL